MSAWKWLLRILELVSASQVLVALLVVLLGARRSWTPASVMSAVLVNSTLVFPMIFVAVALIRELDTATGVAHSWWQSPRVRFDELRRLVRWCPSWLLVVSLACAAGAAISGTIVGGARWSSDEEFTLHHAISFSLGSVLFCALSLPVLASASRMPGRFADHFGGSDGRRTPRAPPRR
jgi:hypothetical protein